MIGGKVMLSGGSQIVAFFLEGEFHWGGSAYKGPTPSRLTIYSFSMMYNSLVQNIAKTEVSWMKRRRKNSNLTHFIAIIITVRLGIYLVIYNYH